MFQPSHAARTTKRATPKPAPKGKLTGKALPADDPEPYYSLREGIMIGRFVRRSADRIAAEIANAALDLKALLIAVDGDMRAGLNELRAAFFALEDAIARVSTAIGKTKVRCSQTNADL